MYNLNFQKMPLREFLANPLFRNLKSEMHSRFKSNEISFKDYNMLLLGLLRYFLNW